MNFKRALLGALLALVVATPVAGWTDSSGSISTTTAATQMFNAIQAEHVRVCGHKLYRATRSNRLATWRSQYMAKRDVLSHHIGSYYFWDYLDNYGNNLWQKPYAAEIIGNNNASTTHTVSYGFSLFMNSASHRAAIQNCTYNTVGVGAARSASGFTYYTAIFTKQYIRRADYTGVPVRTGPSKYYPRKYVMDRNEAFWGFWRYSNGYWFGRTHDGGAGYVNRDVLH